MFPKMKVLSKPAGLNVRELISQMPIYTIITEIPLMVHQGKKDVSMRVINARDTFNVGNWKLGLLCMRFVT